MSLTTFLQQCLTGISLGGAYALIAIGYTLVYGILRLINFAHGDIFMMAGYFMIFAMASLPWFIAIPVTLIVTILLGVTIERVAYRPLRSAPRMSVMISAIGVSYLLQNLATYLFTALPKGYPEIPFLKKIYQIGGLSASFVTFLTPVLTLVLVYLLILLINHTKIGMAMRAVSKDYETASLMGINVPMNIAFTVGLSALICATIGVLVIPIFNVELQMSSMIGLKGFASGVIGGFGYLPGAIVGGILLGVVEIFGSMIIPSVYKDCLSFVLLIIFLLIKPSGILGNRR